MARCLACLGVLAGEQTVVYRLNSKFWLFYRHCRYRKCEFFWPYADNGGYTRVNQARKRKHMDGHGTPRDGLRKL